MTFYRLFITLLDYQYAYVKNVLPYYDTISKQGDNQYTITTNDIKRMMSILLEVNCNKIDYLEQWHSTIKTEKNVNL